MASRAGGLPGDIIARHVVPDDLAAIADAVSSCSTGADLVLVSGGTGLGRRDVSPQAIAPLLDYEIVGMTEAMRAHGRNSTPHAMLSRQIAGVRGRTLVLVLPGSPRGVEESLDAVWPALTHALEILRGDGDHAGG